MRVTRDLSESRSQWTTERSVGIFLALDGLVVISQWTLSLTLGAFGGVAGVNGHREVSHGHGHQSGRTRLQ